MRYFILILLLCFYSLCLSQTTTYESLDEEPRLARSYKSYPWEGMWGIKTGLILDRSLRGEIGIMRTNLSREDVGSFYYWINYNISASAEFNFNPKDVVLGPKVSYTYDFMALGGKLSYIHYLDFEGNYDPRITPELGLTFLGLGDLFYGYNIPLTSHKFRSIGTHRISLYINLFMKGKQ